MREGLFDAYVERSFGWIDKAVVEKLRTHAAQLASDAHSCLYRNHIKTILVSALAEIERKIQNGL